MYDRNRRAAVLIENRLVTDRQTSKHMPVRAANTDEVFTSHQFTDYLEHLPDLLRSPKEQFRFGLK